VPDCFGGTTKDFVPTSAGSSAGFAVGRFLIFVAEPKD